MDKNKLVLEIATGTIKQGDRKGQEWRALKITIGEWSKLVFPNSAQPLITSNFELDYIAGILNDQK